jgi:molybdopterin/thiamine biosynthesis adenylyltransferase
MNNLSRYERQIKIFGKEGQEKLNKARVVVVGMGGLGSAVSIYLTAAGIGHLVVIDPDRVKLPNLNRQILH